jgi:2-C-methyl-D-erythritol 2,4-cyclodiphosphate synthase
MTNILPYRIGHGFDLHRLEPGPKLIIGGVHIEYDLGCAGHSDGDVVYHAVTDAICGAIGQPDIGQLFPDNDEKWKGADSSVFVAEADRLMRNAGYVIGNLDVTVILERPKVGPHKDAIRKTWRTCWAAMWRRSTSRARRTRRKTPSVKAGPSRATSSSCCNGAESPRAPRHEGVRVGGRCLL